MKHTKVLLLGWLVMGLQGCGGGGGSSDEAAATSVPASSSEFTGSVDFAPDPDPEVSENGIFIDSAVQGMAYTYTGYKGVTDQQGTFSYSGDHSVTFSVGDIVIGAANGKAVLTPVSLVPDAEDETDAVVSNIARFLQSLDDDGDLSNGISIASGVLDLAVGRAVDFEQSTIAFEDDGNVQTVVAELTAVTTAGARQLVALDSAQSHLRATLYELYTGSYTVISSENDSIVLRVTVTNTGAISVSCTVSSSTSSGESSSSCSASVSGGLQSSGKFDAIITADGVTITISGKINTDGTINGTWVNATTGEFGSFEGDRQAEVVAGVSTMDALLAAGPKTEAAAAITEQGETTAGQAVTESHASSSGQSEAENPESSVPSQNESSSDNTGASTSQTTSNSSSSSSSNTFSGSDSQADESSSSTSSGSSSKVADKTPSNTSSQEQADPVSSETSTTSDRCRTTSGECSSTSSGVAFSR